MSTTTNYPYKREQARDSRGRPVRGLYRRGEQFIAGYTHDGKWRTKVLRATTLTEAKRERESLLAGLREGRISDASNVTFADLHTQTLDARTLSERTREHELHLLRRHLSTLSDRRVQAITTADCRAVLRKLRDGGLSEWTCVHVHRLMAVVFSLAIREGVLLRSPLDGLLPSERPKQRNKKEPKRLTSEQIEQVVAAGRSERWRAALALAAYSGLRLGELRGLRWGDVNLDAGRLSVERSLQPDGSAGPTKTPAGVRDLVPVVPALDRRLRELRAKRTTLAHPTALVLSTAEGKPLSERNLRRALAHAVRDAGIEYDRDRERLSFHPLRHSNLSALAVLGVNAGTLAAIGGHSDPGFTFRKYVREARDSQTVASEVVALAAAGGFGS